MIKYICIFIVCFFSYFVAGDIEELELRLNSTVIHLHQTGEKLDSLNTALDTISARIEQEKSRSKINNNIEVRWFEEISILSNTITREKENQERLQDNLKLIKNELDKAYAAKIDSLNNLLKIQAKSENQQYIEEEILHITEKRLAILSPFKSFSFNPQKLLQIQLPPSDDSLEYAIYTDYIANAKTEINEVIHSIRQTRTELEETIILEERTDRFLEEIDENRPFIIASQANYASDNRVFLGNEIYLDVSKISIESQARSLFNLLDQFDRNKLSDADISWISPLDSVEISLSIYQYVEQLEYAENFLENYLKFIEKKTAQE